MVCDVCGSKESYIKEVEKTYIVKDKSITIKSDRRLCKKCNNFIYDEELDNEISMKAIELYNESFGIRKEDLINFRNELKLSQEIFSRIIGCAKKTLISYEKGKSIPNDCYLIMLKSIIEKPEIIKTLLEVNKNEFNKKEYLSINNKIDNYLSDNKKCKNELTEFNGFSKYSFDKILNIIIYFSQNTILKTKLLKEMFYADFLYFKNNCKSITGLEYAKLPYGPVPDQFDLILNDCVENKIINYNIEYNNQYECHIINAREKFDSTLFTEEELSILERVKNKFADYNTKEIVDFSHKEKAFTQTEFGDFISYEYAFDIESL